MSTTLSHYAALHKRSEQTIKRWQVQGYPLEDRAAMRKIMDELKARRGVSKTSRKLPVVVTTPAEDEPNPVGDLIGVHFELVWLAWDDPELRERLKSAFEITRPYVDAASEPC